MRSWCRCEDVLVAADRLELGDEPRAVATVTVMARMIADRAPARSAGLHSGPGAPARTSRDALKRGALRLRARMPALLIYLLFGIPAPLSRRCARRHRRQRRGRVVRERVRTLGPQAVERQRQVALPQLGLGLEPPARQPRGHHAQRGDVVDDHVVAHGAGVLRAPQQRFRAHPSSRCLASIATGMYPAAVDHLVEAAVARDRLGERAHRGGERRPTDPRSPRSPRSASASGVTPSSMTAASRSCFVGKRR